MKGNDFGCALVVFLVIMLAIIFAVWNTCSPDRDETVCTIMKKVDYDYNRVQAIKLDEEDIIYIKTTFEYITPYQEGLRLWCENQTEFWGSSFDIY